MEKKLSLEELNNVSEIDVVYKRKINCKVSERPLIKTSNDIYEILFHYWDDGKIELLEEFKVLAVALKLTACSIVLAHNHPSGSLKPSKADEELTHKIKYAAQFHDIRVLHHVIVCSESYSVLQMRGYCKPLFYSVIF